MKGELNFQRDEEIMTYKILLRELNASGDLQFAHFERFDYRLWFQHRKSGNCYLLLSN